MIDTKEVQKLFQDAVKQEVRTFNATRGRRKELIPQFVDTIPYPFRKYGRILEIGDGEPSEALPRMAKCAVKTMLKFNRRPALASLAVREQWDQTIYLFRLVIPVMRRG